MNTMFNPLSSIYDCYFTSKCLRRPDCRNHKLQLRLLLQVLCHKSQTLSPPGRNRSHRMCCLQTIVGKTEVVAKGLNSVTPFVELGHQGLAGVVGLGQTLTLEVLEVVEDLLQLVLVVSLAS